MLVTKKCSALSAAKCGGPTLDLSSPSMLVPKLPQQLRIVLEFGGGMTHHN
jgi:hypothetical protein